MFHSFKILPLFPLVLLVWSCRGPEAYIQRGNDCAQRGKLDEAVLNYRKALQKNPKAGEAFYRLGIVLSKQGNVSGAWQAYNAATTLLPRRQDVRIKLADLAYAIYVADPSRPAAVYNRLNQLIDELQRLNPGSSDVLRLRGEVDLSDNRIDEAIAQLRRADTLEPHRPETVTPFVEALLRAKRYAEAEQLCWSLIANKKEYKPVYSILYLLYSGTNRPKDAQNVLLAQVQNNPNDSAAVLALANHYLNLNDTSDAQAVLQRLLNDRQRFPKAYAEIGDFYVGRKDYPEALRYYNDGLRVSPEPEKPGYLRRSAFVYLAMGERDRARSILENLVASNQADDNVRYTLANIQAASGDRQLLAKAVQTLETLAKTRPENAGYRFNLGKAYLASNNLDGAQKEFLETIRLNRDFKIAARYQLIDLSLRRGEFDDALSRAAEILAANPSDPRARMGRALALVGLKDYRSARAELVRLNAEVPQSPDAQLQIGLLDIAEGKYNEADDLFRKYYRPGQQDVRPLEGLVASHVARKQLDAAAELLKAELQKNPASKPVRSALATLDQQSGRLDAAIDLYRQLAAGDPKSAEWQLRLGDALLSRGNAAAAISAYSRAVQLQPENGRSYALLASAFDALGQRNEAIKNYRLAVKLGPPDPFVMNNLAYALADSGVSLDEALQLARESQVLKPNDPMLQDTVGWVYAKQQLYDAAIQIFGNLVRKHPANASYQYHFAVALAGKGDRKAALETLRNALSVQPAKPEEIEIRQFIARLNGDSRAASN